MARERKNQLTAQIIRKASIGETKKEIARDLGISPTTVQNHLHPLRDQLEERVDSGEDPFGAWVDMVITVLAGAGTAAAMFGCLKFLEEMRKMQERSNISIKMEEREK